MVPQKLRPEKKPRIGCGKQRNAEVEQDEGQNISLIWQCGFCLITLERTHPVQWWGLPSAWLIKTGCGFRSLALVIRREIMGRLEIDNGLKRSFFKR